MSCYISESVNGFWLTDVCKIIVLDCLKNLMFLINIKPLSQIRAELVDMVWARLLRYNIKNAFLNLLPIYGAIRQIYIAKQIKKNV